MSFVIDLIGQKVWVISDSAPNTGYVFFPVYISAVHVAESTTGLLAKVNHVQFSSIPVPPHSLTESLPGSRVSANLRDIAERYTARSFELVS